MKKYKAVIFDLFDTLIEFNRGSLPEVSIDGSNLRSTVRVVYEVFCRYYGSIEIENFYVAFIESYNEFQQMKQKEFREFPVEERFKLLLKKLNIGLNSNYHRPVEEMALSHMEGLANSMEFPEENREVLNKIFKDNYRMSIISNFDHAPTAYMLLDKFNIRRLFQAIVISIEVGWRKPKSDIFNRGLNLLNVRSDEAIFVGDNYEADIVGSKNVGMDAMWINRNNETGEGSSIKPNYIVSSFSNLVNLF